MKTIQIEELTKNYDSFKLSPITWNFKAGKTTAIVGESGSGKSTLAKLIGRLEKHSSGMMKLISKDKSTLSDEIPLKKWAQDIQMVFQNPASALHPFLSVKESISESLMDIERVQKENFISELMKSVNLDAELLNRKTYQLSGGQQQRVVIARALAKWPSILICDEPVSALDLTTQIQVLKLIREIQKNQGLTLILVSHDLETVRHIADDILVLKAGQLVEFGSVPETFANPKSDYLKELIAATPIL